MKNRKSALVIASVLVLVGVVSVAAWATDVTGASAEKPAAKAPGAGRIAQTPSEPTQNPTDCMSQYANDCNDYPVEFGGSCSCTSELLIGQCTVCETGGHGGVRKTTCHVCGAPCQGFPCEFEISCHDYVSYSCAPGRS